MEKKWDTVIPADLKRLFVSGTYMSRWSQKGSVKIHTDVGLCCWRWSQFLFWDVLMGFSKDTYRCWSLLLTLESIFVLRRRRRTIANSDSSCLSFVLVCHGHSHRTNFHESFVFVIFDKIFRSFHILISNKIRDISPEDCLRLGSLSVNHLNKWNEVCSLWGSRSGRLAPVI
jgi:hypothetical protein